MKKKKTYLKYILLGALLVFVGIYYRDFLADAMHQIARMTAWQIALIVLLSFGYSFLEGAVIWLMMKKYVPDYRYLRGVRCALVSAFFRFSTLGSAGMAAQIVELHKDGASPGRAAGMTMVQYLFHKLTITAYGILGFLYLLFFTESGVKDYSAFLWAGTGVTALIAAFLILLCTSRRFSGLLFWAAEKISKGRWQEKIDRFREEVEVLQEEARSLLFPKKSGEGSKKTVLPWIILLDFAKLSCWYLVPCVVLQNVGVPEVLALTAAAQMLAGVIPAPAGLGSLEFVFLLFSTKVAGEGEAVSAMLLLRCAINLIPFLPGLVLSLTDKKRAAGGGKENPCGNEPDNV